MGELSGEENANLYVRGVNEGRSGDLVAATPLGGATTPSQKRCHSARR